MKSLSNLNTYNQNIEVSSYYYAIIIRLAFTNYISYKSMITILLVILGVFRHNIHSLKYRTNGESTDQP